MYLLKKSSTQLKALAPSAKLAQVKSMLVNAVTLELATIPTYLTGVFSVKSGQNQEAKDLVISVVIEEMLHMTLAANVLIAIGGSVDVNQIGTALQYPTPLPGGVDEGLIVKLAPLTKEQVNEVFMGIERPDTSAILPGETAVHPSVLLKQANPDEYQSIGEFYLEIISLLNEIPGVFDNPRVDEQVNLLPWFPTAVPGVPDGRARDLDTATKMINTIIAQGEGAKVGEDPIDPYGGMKGSLAHYFKFGEIFYGALLVADPSAPSGWSYTGDPVPLDPDGVLNLLPNAGLSDYAPGSGAYVAGTAFYDSYKRLLNALNQSFNGEPAMLRSAIGLMYELLLVADRVMLFPADESKPDGYVAAPPFQLTKNPNY